jgi:hypothetical protein
MVPSTQAAPPQCLANLFPPRTDTVECGGGFGFESRDLFVAEAALPQDFACGWLRRFLFLVVPQGSMPLDNRVLCSYVAARILDT